MSRVRSAGIIVYRRRDDIEVLVGHMGGPFWTGKDEGAWSIPKGLTDGGADVDELATARREFEEEMGHAVPQGELVDLGVFEQSRYKEIHVWAVAGDLDAAACISNTFELEWPPKSGRVERFPEVDRAAWFSVAEAQLKVVAGQRQVIDAVAQLAPRAP